VHRFSVPFLRPLRTGNDRSPPVLLDLVHLKHLSSTPWAISSVFRDAVGTPSPTKTDAQPRKSFRTVSSKNAAEKEANVEPALWMRLLTVFWNDFLSH
jgi:hypothetical protein